MADGGPRGARKLPEAAVRYIPVEGPIWGATILCAEKRQQRLPPAMLGEGPTNRVPLLEDKMCHLRLFITLHVIHLIRFLVRKTTYCKIRKYILRLSFSGSAVKRSKEDIL